MKARQSALLDTAHHVKAFLDENATVVGPNIMSARRNFDDAVTQLSTMAVTQMGGVIAARGATAHQRALRSTLRNAHMKSITQVAKIALPDVPQIQQLAVTTKNLSGSALVAAAQSMADAAEPYASVFTANGLPDDFIAQLRAAADAVTTSATGRQLTKASTTGATSGMVAQETRVRTLLKLINALVVPKLGTDATLLSKWRAARAIDHQTPIVPVPSAASSPTASPSAGSTPSTSGIPASPTSAATPAATTPPSTTPPGTTPAAAAPAETTQPVTTAPASTAPANS